VCQRNGAEVLVKASLMQPDAILINDVISGMTGGELSSLLGAMPTTQRIPVVLYGERHLADPHRHPHGAATGRKERFVPTTTPEAIRHSVEELLAS